MDRISKEHRSWNMSRITGKNTRPEIILRSLLHRAGFRYRLHVSSLPGKPDIVLHRFRTVIFVNGCYWHRHLKCTQASIPKTRTEFWLAKFQSTIERDRRKTKELQNLGWKVLVVWECELENRPDTVLSRLKTQLGGEKE